MDDSQTPWNPPTPGTTWEPGVTAATPLPDLPVAPEPPASRKGRRIAAIGATAALVAAGGFAFVKVAGGSKGGADSPAAAVEQFVAAVNDQDVLGMLDLMLPGERATFRQPMIDTVAEMRRLEIVGSDAELESIKGLDVNIELDPVEVTENGDIATVQISGTAEASVDQGELPIGDFLVEKMLDGKRPADKRSASGEFGDGGLNQVATVKRDGRWYVSLWYTVAEQARSAAGLDLPTPEEAIQPVGAATAEEALDRMLDAIIRVDLADIIAGMNPNEAEALQRYAPLFLEDGQNQVDSFFADLDTTFKLADSAWTLDTKGDDATATLDTAEMTVRVPDGTATFTWADRCLRITADDGSEPQEPFCADSGQSNEQLTDLGLESLTRIDLRGIHVTRVDGKWYVSPLATMAGTMVDVMRGLERADLDKLVDGLGEAATGVGEQLGVDLPAVPGLPTQDDPNATVVVPTLPPLVDDTLFPTDDTSLPVDDTLAPSDSVPLDTLAPFPGAICFDEVETTGAIACFERLVADGSVQATDVPVALRFLECGWADAYWIGTTDLTDAEFVSLVTSAHECFAAKVASGEIAEWEEPWDTQFPACWNGINPLGPNASDTVFDDYSACAGG